jgi:hypothetical protein
MSEELKKTVAQLLNGARSRIVANCAVINATFRRLRSAFHELPATSENVFITVSGGVAYLASAPETIKVHIIDYDNLGEDFDTTFNYLSPEAQAFYEWSEKARI